jgi:hypothetical protein
MYSGTLISDLFDLVKKAERSAAKSPASESAEVVLVSAGPEHDSKEAATPPFDNIG